MFSSYVCFLQMPMTFLETQISYTRAIFGISHIHTTYMCACMQAYLCHQQICSTNATYITHIQIHLWVWGNYVNIYAFYELSGIHNLTTSISISTIQNDWQHTSENICLRHYANMSTVEYMYIYIHKKMQLVFTMLLPYVPPKVSPSNVIYMPNMQINSCADEVHMSIYIPHMNAL